MCIGKVHNGVQRRRWGRGGGGGGEEGREEEDEGEGEKDAEESKFGAPNPSISLPPAPPLGQTSGVSWRRAQVHV